MPAYFEQGFSVREPMWHGLGVVLEDYPGREEAIRLAGHDFTLVERPLHINRGNTLPELKGWKAIMREDTGKVFHVAKESYGIVQPTVLWDIADAIVNQPKVHYETGVLLDEGRILAVLAWLDEPYQITGDNTTIYPWVCVSTTNDGSGATKARATDIRVVCWNTFNAADLQGKRSGREFTFRHSKNVMANIEAAKDALAGVRQESADFRQLAEELAAMPIDQIGADFFVTQFIPKPEAAVVSDRVIRNIENARGVVRKLLKGKTVNQDRGFYTAYDLLQVGGEYLDHMRGYRSSDTYMGRTLLKTEPLKAKLVPLVKEAASLRA